MQKKRQNTYPTPLVFRKISLRFRIFIIIHFPKKNAKFGENVTKIRPEIFAKRFDQGHPNRLINSQTDITTLINII